MAKAVQSHPPSPSPKHENASSRNSSEKWYIIWRLDRGTTVILTFISFSGALRLYCIVLNSVPVAPVKAELDAPRGDHLEAVAPVGLQGLLGEMGIKILGHYKISFCSKYMNKNTSGKAPEAG